MKKVTMTWFLLVLMGISCLLGTIGNSFVNSSDSHVARTWYDFLWFWAPQDLDLFPPDTSPAPANNGEADTNVA
jgi:hypothetical protein